MKGPSKAQHHLLEIASTGAVRLRYGIADHDGIVAGTINACIDRGWLVSVETNDDGKVLFLTSLGNEAIQIGWH